MPTYIMPGRAYIGANNIAIEPEGGIGSTNPREGYISADIIIIFF